MEAGFLKETLGGEKRGEARKQGRASLSGRKKREILGNLNEEKGE